MKRSIQNIEYHKLSGCENLCTEKIIVSSGYVDEALKIRPPVFTKSTKFDENGKDGSLLKKLYFNCISELIEELEISTKNIETPA